MSVILANSSRRLFLLCLVFNSLVAYAAPEEPAAAAPEPVTKAATADAKPVATESSDTNSQSKQSQVDGADQLPDVDVSAVRTGPRQLSLTEEIDLFEQKLLLFEVSQDDAARIFEQLRDQVRMRLWQLDMALDRGSAVLEAADVDPAVIEREHPGFPARAYRLPPDVVSIRDLQQNLREVYAARTRMLNLVSADVYAQAVGTESYGIAELKSELDLVILEVRYQSLRLPLVFHQIRQMATRAPVPLIWFVVQLWLAIVIFRWWRRWFPGMLKRMRSGLLAVRPRTRQVLTRLRTLWYIDQVRPPLEWLLLLMFLFGLFQFDGLDFVRDIGSIIVRWLLLTWFAVVLLNAFVARGAGGLAGESASLRLQSMRLIAAWLVLLGLGQELSVRLAGEAALNSWFWRLFQLLSFPVVIRLLDIWHMELYRRLQREGDAVVPLEQYQAQRGVRKWIGSAKVAGQLLLSWLQRSLLRRIDLIDPGRAATLNAGDDVADKAVKTPLPEDVRALLFEWQDNFTKYSATERRELVERINSHQGGIVGIVGERGIGKQGFVRQLVEANERASISVTCLPGEFDAVEADFYRELGIDSATAEPDSINKALSDKKVGLVCIDDLHLLIRPVLGGFDELARLGDLMSKVTVELMWVLTADRYAYQLITRVRPDSAIPSNFVQLRSWSEEQIGDFIEKRCKAAELNVDYSNIRVPRQYMDTAEESSEERNKMGTYAMLTGLSRGNPAIAMRLFADSINMRDDGVAEALMPAQVDISLLENSPLNMLFVLRVTIQVEQISFEDMAENLQLGEGLLRTLVHTALMRGWLELVNNRYRVTWAWFRPVLHLLGRKNLLVAPKELD